jgi:glucose-6-phosphate isomerase
MNGVTLAGVATVAAEQHVPALIESKFASRLGAGDFTLWGKAAEAESAIRLGWVHATAVSRPLVDDILALRDDFRARGLTRVVLCGMGGSSLAPEVITRTAGVELIVLDSTQPAQVSRAVDASIETTIVVVSSKSGSTTETDSQKRAFEAAFTAAGIDPLTRIVIVTDPGSPLDVASREAGYRVFNADPNVGGRYSALTAFGLVPSGLAGVDIAGLLDDADAVLESVLADTNENPGLLLGAAMAGTSPRRDKIAILSTKSSIVGIGDWIEQLVAESTGKEGTGVLPVVLEPGAADLAAIDLLPVHIADDATAASGDSVVVGGTLGAQLMIWEVATAVAGHLLGINPFDQPDVESAKIAARAFLDGTPAAVEPFAIDGDVTLTAAGYSPTATTVDAAVRELLAQLASNGYLSIHAYSDREAGSGLESIRDSLAAAAGGRPTTFGWGPRVLHSTGQYHKGGPAQGVFLQIVEKAAADREVPGRPFTFGVLIAAQARGDAQVLADHHRPVLTLTVTGQRAVIELAAAIRRIGASA